MERIRFITHKGKQILILDISNCHVEETLKLLVDYHNIVSKQPEGSLLTLMIVKNAHFDTKLSQELKVYSIKNKPFIKASAIVGLNGLQTIIFNVVKYISGRNLTLFDDIETAKDWLINN